MFQSRQTCDRSHMKYEIINHRTETDGKELHTCRGGARIQDFGGPN
jgi:hypothetical protein